MKKYLLIVTILIMSLFAVSCSSKKELKSEKIGYSNLKSVENYKLKNLDDYEGITVLDCNKDKLSLACYANENIYFIMYNLNDDTYKVVGNVKQPMYFDFIVKKNDKFMVTIDDMDEFVLHEISEDGRHEESTIKTEGPAGIYDAGDKLILRTEKLDEKENKSIISILDLKTKENKVLKEFTAKVEDFKNQTVTGDLISHFKVLDNKIFYQVYEVENQNVSNLEKINKVSSYAYNIDEEKEENVELNEVANSFIKTSNSLICNLNIKDKPSEQASYIIKGEDKYPLPLGDSGDYFMTINGKNELINIDSPRATYFINDEKNEVKYIDKGKGNDKSIQFVDSNDYDVVVLDKDNMLQMYKIN